jgi:NADP-dependent 3-hydroxy acid dehydrogenase YdfG
VYEGTRPLSAEDVAECVLFAITRPLHVVVDELVVMSIDQSSGARIHRR